MDRYLARTNIEAQQTDKPIDPATRRDNLFEPRRVTRERTGSSTARPTTARRSCGSPRTSGLVGAAALTALAYPALRARSQR